jgi:arylsulfatase A-like enzyme
MIALILLAAACTSAPPAAPPRRLVLIFVDTLRPDHMSVYGYDRQTSPVLDAWAEGAAVFTNARSVAPWTLPSARAALSGRQPGAWDEGPVLMERLAEAGWATGGATANIFLTEELGMSRGMGDFHASMLSSAEDQVAWALGFFDAHPAQDAALLLHIIDPHLPYEEPEPYRSLWAGAPPPPLDEHYQVTELRSLHIGPDLPGFDAIRRHLIDRYDQNIRYVDAALAPLLSVLGPTDGVIVFSDHGEEFWEHGGFEHGHSLYEELVRIPLLVRAPHLVPGRRDAPASLLDVTPTALAIAGLPVGDLPGRSLLDVLVGAPPPLALGRILNGRDQWAVVDGEVKWLRTQEGTVRLDLAVDPGEQQPEAAGATALMGPLVAAGVEAAVVWRLEVVGTEKRARFQGEVTLDCAQGFLAAWGGYDPRDRLSRPQRSDDGARVTVARQEGRAYPGEVYVLPGADAAEASLVVTLSDGSSGGAVGPLPLEVRLGGHVVRLVEDVSPLPTVSEAAFRPEFVEALRALGYLE